MSAPAPATVQRSPDESTTAIAGWDRAFLSNMAHELRTPLTVVRGALAMLGERTDEMPDDTATLYVLALRNSERLSRAIESILDHAAIVAGTLDLVVEPIGATELAEAARIESRSLAERRAVTVTLDIRTARELSGDRVRLARVLASLALHAVSTAAERSIVTVLAVDGPDGAVCFTAMRGTPGAANVPDPSDCCPQDSIVAQGWPSLSGEEVECSSNQLVVLKHGGRLWSAPTEEFGELKWILIPGARQ